MSPHECPICAADGKHSSSSFVNTVTVQDGTKVLNTWRCSRGHHWAVGPEQIAYVVKNPEEESNGEST